MGYTCPNGLIEYLRTTVPLKNTPKDMQELC